MTLSARAALLSACLALPALPAAAQTAPPPTLTAEVLDHRIVEDTEIDGQRMIELSGLAFDPIPSVLYAVSDRAALFTLDFATDGTAITRLNPLSGVALTGIDGAELDRKEFGPEAVSMRHDGPETGTLLIVSENGPRAGVFTLKGRMLSEADLPEPVTDPARQSGKNSGLEAMTELPGTGLLTLPEAPQTDEPALQHRIWRADGSSFFYSSADIGESRVKSMTATPDGRLLMIERTKDKKRLTPHLRLLDPAQCQPDAPCPTAVVALDVPGIDDADFEGLTQVGDGLYLMVSDDQIKKTQRSVFALIRVGM